jgi:hypothetical protein
MLKTYKILNVLFFIAAAALFAASIWYTNWRLFFLGLLAFGYSSFSGSAYAAYAEHEKATTKTSVPTIEEMFKHMDTKAMEGLEDR